MSIRPSSANFSTPPAPNFPSVPAVQNQIASLGPDPRLDIAYLLQDVNIVMTNRNGVHVNIDPKSFVNLINKTADLTYIRRRLEEKAGRLVRLLSTVPDLAKNVKQPGHGQQEQSPYRYGKLVGFLAEKKSAANHVKKALALINAISKLLDERQVLERSNVLYQFFSDASVVNQSVHIDPSALPKSSPSVLSQLPKCICDLMKTSCCDELVPPLLNLNFPETTSVEAYQAYFKAAADKDTLRNKIWSARIETAKARAWVVTENGTQVYCPSLYYQMLGSTLLVDASRYLPDFIFRLLFPRSKRPDITSFNLNWETQLYKDNVEGIQEEHRIALTRALLACYTAMHNMIVQQKLDNFRYEIVAIYYFKKVGANVLLNPNKLTYAEEVLFSSAHLPDQSDISWKKGLVISLIEEGSFVDIAIVQRALKGADKDAIARYFPDGGSDNKEFCEKWLEACPDLIRKQRDRVEKHLVTISDNATASHWLLHGLTKDLWGTILDYLVSPVPQPLPQPKPSSLNSLQQLAISVHAIVHAYSLSHTSESSELDNKLQMERISSVLQNPSVDLVVPHLLKALPKDIRLYFKVIATQVGFVGKATLSTLVDIAQQQAGHNPRTYSEILGPDLFTRAAESWEPSMMQALVSPLLAFKDKVADSQDVSIIQERINIEVT